MRIHLKIAVLQAGVPQRKIAADSQITENRFSEIVRGWVKPTDAERARIAAVLQQSEESLFESEAA